MYYRISPTLLAALSAGLLAILSAFYLAHASEPGLSASQIVAERPVLEISPASLAFTAVYSEPRTFTQTIEILNAGSGVMSWTITSDVAGTLQQGPLIVSISPTTGVNTGTVYVQIDSRPYPTGVFTSVLWIGAQPITTSNNPLIVLVSLRVWDDWPHLFLPMTLRNSTPPTPTPTSTPSPTPTPTSTPTSPPPVTPSPLITHQFGLSFVTSAETPAGELRFRRAAEAGATWDRWPMYWGLIETSDNVFDWPAHDAAVSADIEHGLQLNAILQGPPPVIHRKGPCDGVAAQVYASPPRIGPAARQDAAKASERLSLQALALSDCTTPANLYEAVFSDGSDVLGPGKAINPANPWARFVYTTVMRYKPGGTLATQRGWADGQGVRMWEVWNEPDYTWFWNGNAADYARTVAVAYLAARQADPEARVMLGGISDVNQRPTWLSDTLGTLGTYPNTQPYAWYFDAVAMHSYSWSWATFNRLYEAQLQLEGRGIVSKTLWINESGVPVWDDPAVLFPDLNPISCPFPYPWRATQLEQADYVLQSALYAVWMNAEVVFHFQLYDDCGNGPGMLDAFGLRRNDGSAPAGCYPSDEGARPSFAAYQLATTRLPRLVPKWRWRPPDGGEEWISFYDPAEGNRLLALWARSYTSQTAVLTATSTSAIVIGPDGIGQSIDAVEGRYTLTLPAATNRNRPDTPDCAAPDGSAPIGGRTLLLLELDPSGSGGFKPIGLEE
ncbi:MAG: hypothetical protein JW850_12510 [Thermoflexales bacterium]|nr:hypothetical protein [Thermoflexales bacterium]